MSRKWQISIAVLIVFFVILSLMVWPSSQSFSPDVWKKTEETQRYLLVDDLLNRRLLVGKNRAEVIEMLGEPSGELSGEPSNNDGIYYILKLGGNYFVMVYWLEIRFQSGDGYVSDARVASD